MAVDQVPYVYATATPQNDAARIAQSQISTMQGYASQQLSQAVNAIAALGAFNASIEATSLDLTAEPDASLVTDFTEQFDSDVEYEDPPDFTDTVAYVPVEVETTDLQPFDEEAPVVATPVKNFMTPGAKPEFNDEALADIPIPTDVPQIDLNQVLARIKAMLDSAYIPESVPEYTPVNPDDIQTGLNLVDPLEQYKASLFEYNEDLTDTEITDYLLADIIASLQAGGIGMPEGTEDALYQRHRSRVLAEYNETYEDAEAKLAAQGWVIPTGAMLATLARIDAKRTEALAVVSYEVMVENAKLIMQDRENARGIAVKFEEVYRQYLDGYYNRQLEAAKQLAAESLKVFQIALEQNKLLIANEELRIKLLDAYITASLSELEAFKLKMQAQQIQAEIRAQDVELLKAWIQSALAAVEVYEAQVKAATAVVQNNQAIVQLYAEKMRGYMAEWQAVATQIGAWSAEVDAVYKEYDAYLAKTQAFAAYAGAIESQNRVEIAKAEIGLKKQDVAVEEFKALLQAHLGKLEVIKAKNQTEATKLGAKAQVFAATASAHGDIQRARAAIETSRVTADTNRLQLAVENNKVLISKNASELEMRLKALESVAQVSAQLAAATLSAINVGASISDSFQSGNSTSHNYSAQIDNSLSETV